MKELHDIIRCYRDFIGRPLCLATVVNTRGSTYRKAGARMLIADGRQVLGSISGGCLEADVIAQARQVWALRENMLLTYDTTSPEDILLGTGVGCQGMMEILVEPIVAGNACAHELDLVETILANRGAGLVATAVRREGVRKVVHRLMLGDNGTLHGEFPDDALEETIVARMVTALQRRRSESAALESPAGNVDLFLEFVTAPTSLFIFGAGYDAVPLARMARELGLTVTVVDHRAAFVTAERFPGAALVVGRPENIDPLDLPLDNRAAAVIMSHNFLVDQQWLKRLLPLELGYLGLMGPRRRAEQMLQDLRGQVPAGPPGETGLHNPAGLDLGAESPEQIALAILGEIQAVLTGHSGGFLREKKGPIHSTAAPRPSYAPVAGNRIIQWPA